MYECIRKTLHPGRAPLGKGFTSTKFHAKIKKENKISKKVLTVRKIGDKVLLVFEKQSGKSR